MDWIDIGRTFGVPVMVLGAMMFAVYNVSKWVGKEIIIPLRDAVVRRVVVILDKVDGSLTKLEVNMESYTKVLNNLEVSSKSTLVIISEAVNVLKVDIKELKIKVEVLTNLSRPVLVSSDSGGSIPNTCIQTQTPTPDNPSGITTSLPPQNQPSPKRGNRQ